MIYDFDFREICSDGFVTLPDLLSVTANFQCQTSSQTEKAYSIRSKFNAKKTFHLAEYASRHTKDWASTTAFLSRNTGHHFVTVVHSSIAFLFLA